MLRIRQFHTLAVLTAVEAIRQPIFLLLSAACVLITALTPVLLMHHFGEDGKLARDSGLALHFVFGLFIATYTASSCLDREMRTGTASAVLSKPISREIFFLAKFAGTVAVIVLFSVCASVSTLLSERVSMHYMANDEAAGFITDWQTAWMFIAVPFVAFLLAGFLNYFKKRPFESTAFGLLLSLLMLVLLISGFFTRAGGFAPYDLRVHTGIISVSALVTLALVVVSSIAITLSSRLSIVPTLTICSAVFMLGLISDYLFGERAMTSQFYMIVYRLIPDWQNFWTIDVLSDGGSVPWSYVARAGLYAMSWASGMIFVGLLAFNQKEMK